MNDELLDLVDQSDVVIGTMLRSDVYAQKKNNFRVVNVFVVNDKGQLWIPRRSADKKIFPLCLDASMGGHVQSGETYDQAFERELYEELGFIASACDYTMIAALNPIKHNTSAFMRVYFIKAQEVPHYNKQDFCEYYWLTPQELVQKLASGDKGKGDLIKMVQHIFKV